MTMKLISLKVPVYTLNLIDAQAKDLGISRTELLLKPWQAVPVTIGSDPTVRYIRPKHDLSCKCLMCKPPKP